MAGEDPVHAGVFARLDLLEVSERCGSPDPALFELLAGRHLVAFREQPDDAVLARVSAVATVRWLYRQLGMAEVDANDGAVLAALPFVAAVVPAWTTVGDTRGLVVGLNAVCAFASTQAQNPKAFYRHPPGIGYPVFASRDGRKELDLDPTAELATPPALIPVVNMSLGTVSVGHPHRAQRRGKPRDGIG